MMNWLSSLWAQLQRHRHLGADGTLQIPTGGLEDGAVTTAKLADNSVTSSKIVDGTIATVDLGNGIIVPDKVGTMCYARIYRASGIVPIPANTNTAVPFTGVRFDTTGGAWESHNATRFRVNRAGRWLFGAHIAMEGSTPATRHYVSLVINAAAAFAIQADISASSTWRRDFSVVGAWQCNAGDYVECIVWVDATNWVVNPFHAWGCELWGIWLGQ